MLCVLLVWVWLLFEALSEPIAPPSQPLFLALVCLVGYYLPDMQRRLDETVTHGRTTLLVTCTGLGGSALSVGVGLSTLPAHLQLLLRAVDLVLFGVGCLG